MTNRNQTSVFISYARKDGGGLELRTLRGHSSQVSGVDIMPDDRRAVSASLDSTLKVWDLDTGVLLLNLERKSTYAKSVAVTPGGKRAVSACLDRTMKIWDLDSGRTLRTLEGHSRPVLGIAVSPNGKRAVSASWDKTLKVWNLDSGQIVASFYCDHPATCCVFVDDYSVFADDAGGRVHTLSLDNAK